MSLEIGIGDGKALVPLRGEPLLYMEDAAPYWFLYPLFEKLYAETGQFIDLYGDASFAGAQLIALKETLAVAQRMAEAQPDRWKVSVGARFQQELWEPLHKGTLLDLIAVWELVIARAEELGQPVVCFGD
jgi:hypothetical protein